MQEKIEFLITNFEQNKQTNNINLLDIAQWIINTDLNELSGNLSFIELYSFLDSQDLNKIKCNISIYALLKIIEKKLKNVNDFSREIQEIKTSMISSAPIPEKIMDILLDYITLSEAIKES